MRALLLAAGFGTRLRPLTDKVPKCLVPIRGKPLLSYWLDLLLEKHIDQVLINTHYRRGDVCNFVAQSNYRERISLIHEETLLGTGGTVLKNIDFFQEQPFMVIHADNLSHFDVGAFIRCHNHRPPEAIMTMMTFDTDSPESCGIVEKNKQGLVMKFHEKVQNPPGNVANGAVYIFEPTISSHLRALGKAVFDISNDLIPTLLGRIFTFHNSTYHRDIGTMESLRIAEVDFPINKSGAD